MREEKAAGVDPDGFLEQLGATYMGDADGSPIDHYLMGDLVFRVEKQ